MADYRSILDRAISALPENSEEARRTIYDKARNALMRQLSSLEPSLSPAEISKQRLQLEEAVRDTENRFNGTADLENAVSDAISEIDADVDAPVVDHTPTEPATEASQPDPLPEPMPETAKEPTPEPLAQPDQEPEPLEQAATSTPTEQAAEPAIETPDLETSSPSSAASDMVDAPLENTPAPAQMPPVATEPIITKTESSNKAVETHEVEVHTPDITHSELKGQELIEEAEATHARVDALHTEKLNALDELKQTMAEDGVPNISAPDVSLKSEKTPADEFEEFTTSEGPNAPKTPTVDLANDDAAIIAEASKKPGGKGLIWLLLLLILFGIGTFGWAQRESLEPTIRPIYEKIEGQISGFFNTATAPDTPTEQTPADNKEESDIPAKAEDRILDTPLKTEPEEPEQTTAPEIQPGKRITLPSEGAPASVPLATPVPATPSVESPAKPAVEPPKEEPIFTPPASPEDNASAPAPEAPQATTTPVTNIFTSSAILYEERKDSGRPDVSTGNVVWELLPTGSEAIGSTGLPSVRGNSRIQNRDLVVRFEIMRNLDESLPASHLIEIEFATGELFDNDRINNVAGVLMKEKEQDNGQQLAGAVVKVSDTVFWIAMSARAADLASNVDALKKFNWFDIPVIFSSGKRAILTLEKGAAGAKAIEKAFTSWTK